MTTSSVMHPDDGHGTRAPTNAAEVRRRSIAWFDRYTKPSAAPAASGR